MARARVRTGFWALALALALVPLPVSAAPAQNEARAKELYAAGRDRFEAQDYAGALDSWSDAYGLVSDAPQNDKTRYELLYSIALAHEKAYALDGDASHLRKARDLLLKCQASAAEVFAGNEAAIADEQKRVRGLLDEVVDAMVEDGDAEAEPQEAPPPEPTPQPEATPQPEPTPAPAPGPAPAPAPADLDSRASGKALFVSGLSLIGVGAVGLGVMIGGMVMGSRANDIDSLDPNDLDEREAQIRRGRAGNGMSAGGAIAASLLIPVGTALTIMGRTRMKRASVSAILVPGYAGLNVGGRF